MKAIKFTLQLLGVVFLVSLVMAATLVTPGRKIRDYDRVTTLNDTHIFVVDDEGAANKNNSIAWPNIRKITNGFAAVTYVNNADTAVSNSLLSFVSTNLVWTNNGGIIYPLALNGQATNSIQVYTNGGLSVGRSTLAYWVTPPGAGGEALVSVNNTVNGEIDFKEIFIGVTDTTNNYYFDFLAQPSLTRAIWTSGSLLNMDFQIPDDGNLVFRARGTNGDYAWNFDPGSTSTLYALSSVRPVDASAQLLALQNDGTNKLTAWGTGKLTVESQITNNFLTASKIVLTDAGKGLVSSAFGETDLQGFATTNYVNTVVSNAPFATTNYVNSRLGSNAINFSVQAAKMPVTNSPGIGNGYKNWELIFYKTNIVGSIANLEGNWQFVVPVDYATNSLRIYGLVMLLETNGPASSNTIFRASIAKYTPGDGVDVHTSSFGAKVSVTNTWVASATATNQIQSFAIDLTTNSLIAAGDLAILNLERNSTNDTFGGSIGLTGLQGLYARP